MANIKTVWVVNPITKDAKRMDIDCDSMEFFAEDGDNDWFVYKSIFSEYVFSKVNTGKGTEIFYLMV